MKKFLFVLFLFATFLECSASFKDEILKLAQVGLLPQLQEDMVVKQVSSYDPTGGNDDGFSGKYSYLRKEDGKLVIAELEGPGIIQRIWTPTPSEDTIQFYFDGETNPRIELPFIDLFSGEQYPFVRPVVGNEVGGYYCYLPIPYEKSCKVVFKGKTMQFFQIQYCEMGKNQVSTFPEKFSQEEKDALELATKVWQQTGKNLIEILPDQKKIESVSQTVNIKAGETLPIFKLNKGGRIVGIEITPQIELNSHFKDLILRSRWDNEKVLAINSPLTDFFGYGFGKPAMRSLFDGVRADGTHYCYFPMPFENSAVLELQFLKNKLNETTMIPLQVTIYYTEEKLKNNEGRFYAEWHRNENPELGAPYQILSAKGRGHYVGTLLQSQGRVPGMTLFFEGDDECTVDGELTIRGTGSEDYFNGGWYGLTDRWDKALSLPMHGCLGYSASLARTGGFRFYLTDKISFGKSILMTIEHGPENNNIPVDYTSLAFYYCDTPPESNELPAVELLEEIKPPATLEYWTNLLPMKSIGYGKVTLTTGNESDKNGQTYHVVKFETALPGLVNFELNVPSEGKYKLYLSYLKGPDGGAFDVFQRQIPVKESIPGYAAENTFVEKEYMGTIDIQNGTNTISVILNSDPKNLGMKSIMLNRFYLEKAD